MSSAQAGGVCSGQEQTVPPQHQAAGRTRFPPGFVVKQTAVENEDGGGGGGVSRRGMKNIGELWSQWLDIHVFTASNA